MIIGLNDCNAIYMNRINELNKEVEARDQLLNQFWQKRVFLKQCLNEESLSKEKLEEVLNLNEFDTEMSS